jgi:2-polyprenyl-6-methoxyphenol hydroxylase-like FAD-dependent oxidoreductase
MCKPDREGRCPHCFDGRGYSATGSANAVIGKQAVVIGAGMGGLAAAGALAGFFEHVVVLERDELPAGAADRQGTPQGRHNHALLAGGQRALGALFPGFEPDLVRADAVPLRVAADFYTEMPGFDPFPQRDLGWHVYSMSRPLIELTVRRQVEQFPNVTLRAHCGARSLEASGYQRASAVVGVRCEDAQGKSETVSADLVVDASGRGGLTCDLLEAVGLQQSEATVIGVDIGYASAVFEIPDTAPAEWKAVLTMPQAPESSRGALLLPLEGGERWMISIGGRYGEKPPGDAVGFLDFAGQLRTPTIYNAIRRAARLSEVARFGFPASVWRHFERLEAFPRGLLPFGDAICRFNPVWGQGMTVAAQEAVLLRRLLGSSGGECRALADLAPAFFTEACSVIESPWGQAAVPDFVMPETKGQRPPDFANQLRFGGALARLAAEDPDVHKLLAEVRHLIRPSSDLRAPDLVARVQALMTPG